MQDLTDWSEKKIYDECLKMTKYLVSIPSVNSTKGEVIVADSIIDKLKELPYFKSHPEYVIEQQITGDKLGRKNVFALVRGCGERTIILHGHIDTVDVDNYEELAPYAFDIDGITHKMAEKGKDKEIENDIQSGYIFGRGSCDMKCGDALNFALLHYFSEHTDELNGNLIFMANPDEEKLHEGVIAAVSMLDKFKEFYGFSYLCAISTDTVLPEYAGDKGRYVYLGAVGKVLPAVYILGKETHIGECFEGIDSTALAARIASRIHMNMDFSDYGEDCASLPPSLLRLQDNREGYSVNTALWTYMYFNFLIYNSTAEEIIDRIKGIVSEEVKNALTSQYQNSIKYSEKNFQGHSETNSDFQIMTFSELDQRAREYDPKAYETAYRKIKASGDTDVRDKSRILVNDLLKVAGINENAAVILLAPPYMPHNTLDDSVTDEKKLHVYINKIINEFNDKEKTNIKPKKYYVSLSDSSYLKCDDPQYSIDCMKNNLAGYDAFYNLPLDEIKQINIPALNFGCYGKDAHRATERLDVNYSFRVLPKLMAMFIMNSFIDI